MIECIGLPLPAVGSAGCSSGRNALQYGAANVNVGGAGTAASPAALASSSRWYTRLGSPTLFANCARTARSSSTRHAPVCVPITLVSTVIRGVLLLLAARSAVWQRAIGARYGDAHVSF